MRALGGHPNIETLTHVHPPIPKHNRPLLPPPPPQQRFRHKRVIDALNVQTRQGIPVRRSLARLRAEAQRVLDHKIRLTDDEAKILVAALAECQLRLVLEAELELAGGLYWNAIFWQVRACVGWAGGRMGVAAVMIGSIGRLIDVCFDMNMLLL
jgi:hypothetical protein